MKIPATALYAAAALLFASVGYNWFSGGSVASAVGAAVKRYCSQPADTRLAYRNAIAQYLDGNRVEIHCAGDQ